MNRQVRHAVPVYGREVFADERVRNLSRTAKSAYVRLLAWYRRDGDLPTESGPLALRAKLSREEFEALWPEIEPLFERQGNRLVDERMERGKARREGRGRGRP